MSTPASYSNGEGNTGGQYFLLMGGNVNSWPDAKALQERWKGYCASLVTQNETFKTQFNQTMWDVVSAHTTLSNADTDNLAAADVWAVFRDLTPTSSTTTPPSTPPK